MRFHAVVKRPEALKETCGAVASLQKTCQIHVTPDRFNFVSFIDRSGAQLWCSLGMDDIFEEYVVNSADQDRIIMDLSADNLYRALKSFTDSKRNIDDLQLKLKRRGKIPLLAIMYHQQSSTRDTSESMVIQELQVRLLRTTDSDVLAEPVLPDPDVYVLLPGTDQIPVQRITERLKSLSSRLDIEVLEYKDQSSLILGVSAEGVAVSTKWTDLLIPMLTGGTPSTGPSTVSSHDSLRHVDAEGRSCRRAFVRVNSKDWSHIVQCHAVAKHLILGISDHHALILYCFMTDIDREDAISLSYCLSHVES